MRLRARAAVPLPNLLYGRKDGAHHRCAVGEMVLEGDRRGDFEPGPLRAANMALTKDQTGRERRAGLVFADAVAHKC